MEFLTPFLQNQAYFFQTIYKKYGQDKNTLKFLNYHSTNIAEVYNFFNMEDVISFLASYDSENKEKYLEYLK